VSAWYLDTSAFVKLVRDERYSAPLRRWIEGRETAGDLIVSSDVLRTEAIRVGRRAGDPAVLDVVLNLLDRLEIIRVDAPLFERAGHIGPASLGSLDALHLAAALELGADLSGVVAYDERMLRAASEASMAAVSPGR